jgi:hypothetical protein
VTAKKSGIVTISATGNSKTGSALITIP